MSEALRLYQYKSLLSSRRAVPGADLMAGQEVSAATFKRDIAKMRDQIHMPTRYDRTGVLSLRSLGRGACDRCIQPKGL